MSGRGRLLGADSCVGGVAQRGAGRWAQTSRLGKKLSEWR
jgi:hypothetical protein